MDICRVSGAVFGAAAADAVGASFEGMMPDDSRMPEMAGGGQFSLAAGEVTDDTLMMLALLETYAEAGCFSRELFFSRMIQTIRVQGKTFGNTTRTLAALVEQGCFPEAAALVVHRLFGSRTNGSVMRTLPIGLTAPSKAAAEAEARRVSSFTHADSEAADACAAVSSAVYSLLHGASKAEVLEAVPAKYLEGELWPSVDALESTRCAFCIFRDADDYRDAVARACRLGGDTDTIGAVVGGMYGAYQGLDAVPSEWREMLDVKDRLTAAVKKIWG